MSLDEKTVTYETRDHIAIITFNRPMQRNAVNNQLALELENAVAQLESDDNIHVGILTGVTANVKMTHYRQLKIDPPEAK